MNRNFLLLVLSTSLLAHCAFAGSRAVVIQSPDTGWENALPVGPVTIEPKFTWIAGMNLSAGWENAGETQSIFIAPQVDKTFKADRATHIVGNFELLAGIQRQLSDTIQGQFGLTISASNKAPVSGVIWDDLDPTFDNYTYSYRVQHSAVTVKGKFLADLDYWVTPWLSCGVGIGINKASAYYNLPRISEAVSNPNFSTHSMSTLTYNVGAGVQKAMDEHWQLGIGYEFSDWGKSTLTQGPAQVYNSGLSLTSFYTNALLLNITYISGV